MGCLLREALLTTLAEPAVPRSVLGSAHPFPGDLHAGQLLCLLVQWEWLLGDKHFTVFLLKSPGLGVERQKAVWKGEF